MSEFKVQVVRVGTLQKHENADTLSIAKVFDYPVILKTGEFKEGDLAVYVPVDAIVPVADQRWAFLEGHTRIKARRLRGVFSMGLLTLADPAWTEGQDVREVLGITKYEPPEPLTTGGEDEHDPGFMPCYTDIEGLRRWPDMLHDGELVVITEKIHGCNGRWTFRDGRLWCASHHNWKKQSPESVWWQAADKNRLAEILAKYPDFGFYGEVYGQVQDLKYGTSKNERRLAMFDVMEIKTKRYLDDCEARDILEAAGLPVVPTLYRGPWNQDLRRFAEGYSTIDGANHVREGMVVKPTHERFDDRIGRVVLKIHGEGYLTRKEK